MKYHLSGGLLLGLFTLLISPLSTNAQSQTYIVSTTDDIVDDADNVLSLREAILAANANNTDGDVIQFDNTLAGQTFTLALGEIAIKDDLIIGDDFSPVPVTIDANGASRIFFVSTLDTAGARNVSMFDIIFLNGLAVDGGALWIGEGETVSCVRCVFDGNTASGNSPGQGGGAIFNAGALSLMYTDIKNNKAITGAGNGGGLLIAPTGSLSMAAGTFEGNIANRAGGAVENNGGSASFQGILFSRNIAGRDAESAAPGNGGAIHVSGPGETMIQGGVAVGNKAFSEGGAFWNGTGLMTVNGVTLGGRGTGEPNIASGPDADNGGGGLFNAGGTLNVIKATLIANIADGAAGSGGGILSDGGVLSVTSSNILWNNSSRAGGGIESTNGAELMIEDVEFSQNATGPAPGNGAAIHVTGTGNTTITGGSATSNRAASEGGAFWNGAGTMTITNTRVGGPGAVMANVASGDRADNGGGGLFNKGGTMIVDNVDIGWNIANGMAGSGGGVLTNGGSVELSNSVIQGNISMRAGGGIESTNGAELLLVNVDFIENMTGPAPGNGGAVHVTGSGNSTIRGGKVIENHAASEGGGFWNGTGKMSIENSQIGGADSGNGNTASGSSADNGGGGLFNDGGTMIVLNAWIEGNIADGASGSGGGVLNDGGKLQMDGTMMRGNIANRAGGGVESNGLPDADGTIRTTTDTFNFVTLENNVAGAAPGNGGGFHLTGAGNVTFSQSLAVNNEAGNEGGGFWNSGIGSIRLLNSTVSGNSAPMGGGLFQQAGESSSFQIWLTTLARNRASESGGGFQSDGGLPIFFNSILAENWVGQTVSNCAGVFSSIGRNLIDSLEECSLTPQADDIIGQPAQLQELADNGGPTATHALMNTSPAINGGACITSIMEDQRGTPRMAPCDIGAFESDGMPVVDSGITFTLINAETDTPIAGFDPIANGMNIMRSDLPDQVNVRANVDGNPGSIVFDFNGVANIRTENFAPYALFGDLEGDYLSGVLEEGIQSVTAKPYSLSDGEGQLMTAERISFTIVGSSNVVTRFVLVDADTDQDIMVLENDIIIAATDLPANLNVRAEAGSATQSVTFSVGEESRTEVVRPFALFGDIAGDYLNQSVPPGMYEFTATPYDAAGREGVGMTLRATVTDGSNTTGSVPMGTMRLPADEAVILSDESSDVPGEFTLNKNYPNPFNPTTVIGFSVPKSSQVELVVFNLLGQRVETLVSGMVQQGTHQVSLDARNLPSGIYLYRLNTPQGSITRKMILAK